MDRPQGDELTSDYEDNIASLKTGDTRSIPFEIANVVGGIHVNYPGFMWCKCCCLSGGWINLATSERWRFDEIDKSCYQVQRVHERAHDREFPKAYRNTLLWERYMDSDSKYEMAQADLPFIMDQDTRLCRLNVNRHQKRHWDPSKVIAIMNQEGIIFVDGLEEATEIETEIETANIRELILMTGLAIAKLRHCDLKAAVTPSRRVANDVLACYHVNQKTVAHIVARELGTEDGVGGDADEYEGEDAIEALLVADRAQSSTMMGWRMDVRHNDWS
ncbi:hypothetical protein N7510_000056 [Penicillium lagena]|uniref:uncharacterized protein n=1 Tax=Penicillium lagena TaxID=94218 RepID=UPI00253F8C7E|nr:uncharacterized protein N7510_000056 [Penicillium lagena]KAJ5623747.1 hypothetical protein N7510_000056 [Penicillium lagena]